MKEKEQSKMKKLFQFILYNIILGVFGWIVISYVVSCEGNPNYTNGEVWLYLFIVVIITSAYGWFLFTTIRKCKWDVFNKYNDYTDIIAKCIVAAVIILLAVTVGILKFYL